MSVFDWRDGKQTTVTSKDKHYKKLSEKQTEVVERQRRKGVNWSGANKMFKDLEFTSKGKK